MPSLARLKYVPALDGIRGVAIIWVVFHNTRDLPYPAPGGVFHVLSLLGHMGWIGVQLFFGLSGFLITAGLLDSRSARNYFSGFYARRALRILPLYYAVLLILLIILPRLISSNTWPTPSHQVSLWLFTVNWTQSAPYGFAHFWSLAVEEQFYLFWPVVVYRLNPRRLLVVCLWIGAGALVLRSVMMLLGADGWALYSLTPYRMDALALGGAGACALRIPELRRWLESRAGSVMIAALATFIVGIPLTHIYDRYVWTGETFGYTLLAACSAAFVTAVVTARSGGATAVSALLGWGPLRSLGRYSYAMYVFHGLLHKLLGEPWLMAKYGEHPPVQAVFLYSLVVLLTSYLLGYCSYWLLEQPFLRLKRLVEPRFVRPHALI